MTTLTKVGKVVDFLKILECQNFENAPVFRGQANAEWKLKPSIQRMADDCEYLQFEKYNWQTVQRGLMEKFKRYSVPYLDRVPANELEWLVEAQHHGLPTSLLDLTTNPLIALFFAVEASVNDDKDGAVFLADTRFTVSNDLLKMDENDSSISAFRCFHPSHTNTRIVAQSACFYSYYLTDDNEPLEDLENLEWAYECLVMRILFKVIIPFGCKQTIRRELEGLGITARTVYPGLDGISKSITQRLKDGSKLYPDEFSNQDGV